MGFNGNGNLGISSRNARFCMSPAGVSVVGKDSSGRDPESGGPNGANRSNDGASFENRSESASTLFKSNRLDETELSSDMGGTSGKASAAVSSEGAGAVNKLSEFCKGVANPDISKLSGKGDADNESSRISEAKEMVNPHRKDKRGIIIPRNLTVSKQKYLTEKR